SVHLEAPLVAHRQATEVPQPSKGPLHLPAPPVPAQLPPVLQGRALAVAAVWADQLDVPLEQQPLPQRVAVVALVADQAPRAGAGVATPQRHNVDLVQGP